MNTGQNAIESAPSRRSGAERSSRAHTKRNDSRVAANCELSKEIQRNISSEESAVLAAELSLGRPGICPYVIQFVNT